MADKLKSRLCRSFRTAYLRVGRSAFALFVVCTMLAAPGAALGLSLQRPMLEELNEHRAELEGSPQAAGVLQNCRRKTGGRAIPAVSVEIAEVKCLILAGHHGRAVDEQGAIPAGASWSSPLRC